MNQQMLQGLMNNLNPIAMLNQVGGLSPNDAQKVLTGDYSPVASSQILDIINFDEMFQKNTRYMSLNLIRYFFKKARLKENLTQKEIELYTPAYNFLFKLLYEKAKDFIFATQDDMSDHNLVVTFEGFNYLFTKIGNIQSIVHLPLN